MAVLNKRDGKIPRDAIYIGRGSKWGNPFVIGKDGSRDEVCEKYAAYLRDAYAKGVVSIADFAELHDKDLVCFCAPKRCHGHTLEKWAARAASVEPPPPWD